MKFFLAMLTNIIVFYTGYYSGSEMAWKALSIITSKKSECELKHHVPKCVARFLPEHTTIYIWEERVNEPTQTNDRAATR